MENVKVSIMDKKPCEVSIALEINTSEVDRERDIVFGQIHRQAKIPGYRQGKAPIDIVKKTYSDTARERIIQNLMSRVIPEVLRENNIKPVSPPSIEKYDFDFDKPFTFQVKIEKQPEVKVKDYKKIKIRKKIYRVEEKQLTEQLDALRDKHARLIAVENEPAQKEHFAVVDYEGTIDGKKIPGGSAKNQMINLGASQMIKGFAEGIIGATAGEQKEVKLNFPADYPQKEFAGKEAVFFIAVSEIKKKLLPECDDEFAKDAGFQSLDELKSHIRQDLEKSAGSKTEKEVREQVIEHLLKENVFAVPGSLVEEHAKTMLERTRQLFQYQGYPEHMWEKQKEASQEKIKPEAEKQVRLSYIFSAIAKDEKIEAAEEDLSIERDKMHKEHPDKEKAVQEYINKNREEITSRIKEDRIFKFLFDNAKIKVEK